MSKRYNGGIITSDNISANGVASGIWSIKEKYQILDGSTSAAAAPSPTYLYKSGIRTDGIYWLNPNGYSPNKFYINFTYKPGTPMVMVLANRRGNGGMSNLTYANATGKVINSNGTYDSNRDFNLWVGLDYWGYFGDTIVAGVYGYQSAYSSGTHNVKPASMSNLAKWKFGNWGNSYAFQSLSSYSTLIGRSIPGFYSYHAVNGYNLSTYDVDQDVYSGNCSTTYGNNPWWYGACWDGNFFAGGSGYQDASYWTSSTTEWYAYGVAYICFYDTVLQ